MVLEGQETISIDGRDNTGSLGTGKYVFRLYDESGKININRMQNRTAVILNNLIVNLGTPKEQADIIVDSISDWIDGDNLARLNGAESEYYQSLPNPYDAKNARLDTLEELMMVKGMTADILFGTKERKGLIQFLTVYSRMDRINMNAAPKEVLMALPDVTEEIADRIVERRQSIEFKSIQDIQMIEGINYRALAPFVDIGESNVYTIESVGFQSEEKKGYGIRAVVSIDTNGAPSFKYYKSPAEIRE
ncbi:MAG TPA: helix-hairpin-helix domain-containing protein [Syntrophorhabdaceae bacterium]|nr:helix-hairpin-helix domain-containing protein [Syntrophorhabdaceae bacterium]